MKYRGEIDGLIGDVNKMEYSPRKFAIDYTADALGKTLSIGDLDTGIQYTIAFDALYKIITGR